MRTEIERWARALGFSAFGIAAAEPGPEREALREFLARGFHGDMAWMAANAARRGDPNQLWPEARSIIMLAADYTPQNPPGDILAAPERGAIIEIHLSVMGQASPTPPDSITHFQVIELVSTTPPDIETHF